MTEDNTHTDLAAELAALRQEVHELNQQRVIRAHSSWMRMLWFYFVRGLAVGLGTVIGATFLVSMAAFFLSQIDFIPIIGDWANLIVDEITRDRMEPIQ